MDPFPFDADDDNPDDDPSVLIARVTGDNLEDLREQAMTYGHKLWGADAELVVESHSVVRTTRDASEGTFWAHLTVRCVNMNALSGIPGVEAVQRDPAAGDD